VGGRGEEEAKWPKGMTEKKAITKEGRANLPCNSRQTHSYRGGKGSVNSNSKPLNPWQSGHEKETRRGSGVK